MPAFDAPSPSSCSTELGSTSWRLRVDSPGAGDDNMRRDRDALEAQRDPGALPSLRFFRWAEPTVSFGRLQNPAGAEALCQSVGARGVVQRPTGGGMVVHGNDLSFSLAWRRDIAVFPTCLKRVYSAIHGVAARVLVARGFEVELYRPRHSLKSLPGLCFNEPVEGDVLWRGEKVVGGALKVTAWGRLYQGDIRTERLGIDADALLEELVAGFEQDLFRKPPLRGPEAK